MVSHRIRRIVHRAADAEFCFTPGDVVSNLMRVPERTGRAGPVWSQRRCPRHGRPPELHAALGDSWVDR